MIIATTLTREALVCLCLLFAFAHADKSCDRPQCKGPLKYYEELKCKPVYAQPDDCCPVSFDCSHLDARKPDKCYANGHEYSIGDELRNEDRTNPCEVGCRCIKDDFAGGARFICAIADCFINRVKAGCYLERDGDECCASKEVCPENAEEMITCQAADGKIYSAGQRFQPKESSDLVCTCKKGFKGEFVEPFCKKVSCGTDLRHSAKIYNKCIPVYYGTQSPSVRCNLSFRCPSDEDQVIKAAAAKSPDNSGAKTNEKCKFGNITMEVGDKLNEVSKYKCAKCTCEVPPTPTCLEDADCPY